MQLNEEDVPKLSEFVENRTVLEGKKININTVLNIPLIFTGWKFSISKFQDKDVQEKLKKQNENKDNKVEKIKLRECLTLQFIYENEKRVLFTSSSVLIQQLRDFIKEKPDASCFKACIQYKDNRFYKFSI